jgi:hypothetical protein
MKRILAFTLIFIVGLSSGCNKKDKDKNSTVFAVVEADNKDELEFKYNNKYTLENVTELEDCDFAMDIEYFNESLIVSATSLNKIIVTDLEGNIIREIGETGSEPGQFIQPEAIYISENNEIFIGDNGNKRIQVFDIDFKYIREISYADILTNVYHPRFVSILEADNTIYTNIIGFDHIGDSKLAPSGLYMTTDDKTTKINDTYYGSFFKDDDKIYFNKIGIYEIMANGGAGAFSDITSVFEINVNNRTLTEIKNYNFKYQPTSICKTDKGYISYFYSYNVLNLFDEDFNYIETLWSEEISEGREFSLAEFTMDSLGNIYFLEFAGSKIIKYEAN